MHFLPNERVALFIDGANLYSASRNLGFDVDYRNLLEFFRRKAHVVRAYYYSAVLETDEYSPLKPLTDWLAFNWFTLWAQPAKGVHRCRRSAARERQHGYRGRGGHVGTGAANRPRCAVQRRLGFPPAGRG